MKRSPIPPPATLQQALTLLELLIVVVILAILTTVATRSLVSVGEQAQFEANDSLGRDFRRALIGTPGSIQSDGTPSASGFITDMGRPPRAELESYITGENEAYTPATGSAYTLRELVSQRNGPSFRVYRPDISTVSATNINPGVTNIVLYDSTNSVATGWRGPYMSGGSDDVIDDSWGKPVAAYSAIAGRSLINMWITSYLNSSFSPPSSSMAPYTGLSLNGYHDLGVTFSGGNFPLEVLGIVIRPGAAATAAVGNSLSLAAYTNTYSAGIVWTNDFVSQLLCNLTIYTNRITDTSFTTLTTYGNYWYLAGVIMYGPNPLYNAAATATYATSRPVGVAYLATGSTITATGIGGGTTVNYPNSTSLTFTNYPVLYTTGTPSPAYSYPLVMGPKVLKPFLVAKRKSGISTGTDVAFWTGTSINVVLRPGFNTVQLSVP